LASGTATTFSADDALEHLIYEPVCLLKCIVQTFLLIAPFNSVPSYLYILQALEYKIQNIQFPGLLFKSILKHDSALFREKQLNLPLDVHEHSRKTNISGAHI
jgi:hypothetical protein